MAFYWSACGLDRMLNYVEAPGPVPWPLEVPTWDIYNAGWWSGRASKV